MVNHKSDLRRIRKSTLHECLVIRDIDSFLIFVWIIDKNRIKSGQCIFPWSLIDLLVQNRFSNKSSSKKVKLQQNQQILFFIPAFYLLQFDTLIWISRVPSYDQIKEMWISKYRYPTKSYLFGKLIWILLKIIFFIVAVHMKSVCVIRAKFVPNFHWVT